MEKKNFKSKRIAERDIIHFKVKEYVMNNYLISKTDQIKNENPF
jgi:hypothetical protein